MSENIKIFFFKQTWNIALLLNTLFNNFVSMQQIKSLPVVSSCKIRASNVIDVTNESNIKIAITKVRKNWNIPSLSNRWGRTTFSGGKALGRNTVSFRRKSRESKASTHACTHDIVKMQLTHDSTFCRGRGYETKSPHLQGTLK